MTHAPARPISPHTLQSTQPPRRSLGLMLCQLAVPALAIPSAIGVAKFFSVADGISGWTAQGIIAALGFELMNIGLSILDIRHPAIHRPVQQVRFWSVTTAIAMNTLAHYAIAVPDLDRLVLVPALLALVASVPLAILYVALAGLLHQLAEQAHHEADEHAIHERQLAAAHTALSEAQARLAAERERATTIEREAQTKLADEQSRLATIEREAQARFAAERERATTIEREAQTRLAAELTHERETQARLAAELVQIRGNLAEALQARQTLVAQQQQTTHALTQAHHDADQIRQELDRVRDRSREALMREARALATHRGWGPAEIARTLGWPESTVRGWLPTAKAAHAAD